MTLGRSGFLGLGLAVLALTPAAATTYDVTEDVGSFVVTGTITTNGDIGVLNATDILSWSLTITDGKKVTLLNNSDSNLSLSGDDLTATKTNLVFDFDDTDRRTGGELEFTEKGASSPYIKLLSAYVDGSSDGVFEVFADDKKQQEECQNCDDGSIIALAQSPLPAALPLFAAGVGAVGLLIRRRKRNASAAEPA
jgi:hypothetical protein